MRTVTVVHECEIRGAAEIIKVRLSCSCLIGTD